METTPQPEVSSASPEDRLAAAFEKAGYGGTQKEEPDEPEEQAQDDGDSAEETQSDAEDDLSNTDSEASTDDAEEVEY